MNAVIYARYSSHGQRDVSIEDQIREIEAYAKYHNINIIKTYADRKKTGRTTDKRKEFLKMVSDSEKRTFQRVLVYKYDRFARSKFDSVIYKKKLKDNGVTVVAVAEPIPEGHGATILESIYEAMAEEYSANLSQNVKRGQKGNALKCMANHIPAFGFRTNQQTRKFEADPEEAPIVQSIFSMIIAGKEHKEVLEYMKSIGKPRSANWLYHLLRNERYTGVYIHGDVRIENGMPQIISKEDFEKVREITKLRQHKPQLRPYNYLLSGRIYCGYCHKLMSGESAKSHTGTIYRYYACMESKKKKTCVKNRISAEYLENKVVESLKETIFEPEIIDRMAQDMYDYLNKSNTEAEKQLKSQLSDVNKRMNNIQDRIETAENVPDTLISRLYDLEQQKKELSAKLSAEQLHLQANNIKIDDLKDFIQHFDRNDAKSLINAFVTSLTVFNDYAIIEYDSGGDNRIRFDFVPTINWRNSVSPCTKYGIVDAKLYIRVPLAA